MLAIDIVVFDLFFAVFDLVIAVFDLVIAVFGLVVATFDLVVFNFVVAIFNLIAAVFDLVVAVVVDVDIVVLFPPSAGRMLPNPSAGLVWSRWSLLPSWHSQPLRWDVWCLVLILRWFARLGLLMSSFPMLALSCSRRRGVSSRVVIRYGGIGCRGQSVRWNEQRNGENEPRLSSLFIFRTYHPGLPLLGSPLLFLIPLFLHRASRKPPTSLSKGEGQVRVVLASEVSCGI